MSETKLLVALDFDDTQSCLEFVSALSPEYCRLKVGKELFVSCGPTLVEQLQQKGFDIFLDLKFHDIPNTVAKAVKAAANLGVWMVNVHASGGRRMMEAASDALEGFPNKPLLIGVTVLTSMDQSDLLELGVTQSPALRALELASMAKECGLDGVVCSAHEVEDVKARCSEDFLCVTPGIRPSGSEQGDQRRVMTPTEAVTAGSDFIVVGRPITQSEDPGWASRQISDSIANL